MPKFDVKKFLPKSIMIFGSKWTISANQEISDHGFAGLCHKGKQTIEISSSHKDKNSTLHTLVHEMMHAMCTRVGIDQAISNEMEEMLSENVATMMVENFELKFRK